MKSIIILIFGTISFVNSHVLLRNAATCGLPTVRPDLTTNIVGGKDVIPYSWPWQVALFKLIPGSATTSYQFCGGSLISNQWIVTAGHCFFQDDQNLRQYSVKLGVFNKTRDDEIGEQVVGLSEIHVHPQYNPNTVEYDVTLLKLSQPVQFTDHISPVCLPATQNEAVPNANTDLFVTGWGRTTAGGPASATLKQVTIPLVSTQQCKAAWNPGMIKENVMFCGGFQQGGKSPCNGDSGGPVVVQDPANNGAWKLLGITSWGPQFCAAPKLYAVFSRVSAYVNFIRQYATDLV